jgi:hypothetical protein
VCTGALSDCVHHAQTVRLRCSGDGVLRPPTHSAMTLSLAPLCTYPARQGPPHSSALQPHSAQPNSAQVDLTAVNKGTRVQVCSVS